MLGDLSATTSQRGRFTDAAALLSEAIAIQRRVGDLRSAVESIRMLANLARRQADYAGARSHLEEYVRIGKELRDPFLEARGLNVLAELWWEEGDHTEAQRLYGEAAALGRPLELRYLRTGDSWLRAMLAMVASSEGDRTTAADLCREAIAALATNPAKPRQAYADVLDVVAVLATDIGELQRAARLIGAADGIRFRSGSEFAPFRDRGEYQRAVQAVRDRLGDAFGSAVAAGAALSTAEIVELAEAALG